MHNREIAIRFPAYHPTTRFRRIKTCF